MNIFGRKNYIGARFRTYYSPDGRNVSYTWGEWKTKNRNKTFKTRTCLNTDKATIKFCKDMLIFFANISNTSLTTTN
jgi:hypothetical protein